MGNTEYRITFERKRSDSSSSSSKKEKKGEKKKDKKKDKKKEMEKKYGKKYWKLWAPMAGAAVVTAVLLATLIPRPVPCEMTISSIGICGTLQNDTIVIVRGSGFLDIQGNRPVVLYNNELVPGILEECYDLNIYRRPGVYNCYKLTLYIPTSGLQVNETRNLTIVNSDPCNSGLQTDLFGVTTLGVLIFFASPSVIYFNTTTQVTIYTSGLTSPAQFIVLRHVPTNTEFNFTQQPSANPNQVVIVVQANQLPIGDYDIIIASQNDSNGCNGTLSKGLLVTNASMSMAISSVTPAFIWNNASSSPVTIQGAGFRNTPRVFLANNITVARELNAVTFVSSTSLTAVIRKGLPVGTYDLVLINPPPSNELAFQRNAISVVSNPPPVITAVTPDSYVTSTNSEPGSIQGENFMLSLNVTINCRNDPITYVATVTSVTPTLISMTVPASTIGSSKFCVVTVTNPDGMYAIYSGISMKPPSLNLPDFDTTTPTLTTPRRAPALALGKPTSSSKALYAIGGDNGTGITYTKEFAYDTVEVAPIDIFGTMGTWSLLPQRLPTPCTFGSAVTVSNFIYLVCGNDGMNATTNVYRAQVLDPLATPTIDLSINVDTSRLTSTVLTEGGIFQYRVSAVFANTDESNPGGESLPGDPYVVSLPKLVNVGQFVVSLQWDSIPEAVMYRVYRSVNGTAGAPLGLIAEVNTTYYFDDGAIADIARSPLQPLSLGEWHSVASLNIPRAWAATASAPDFNNATRAWIYVFGGIDAERNVLSSFEYLNITIIRPDPETKGREAQQVGLWRNGTTFLSGARYGLNAAGLTNAYVLSIPPGRVRIYIAGGRTNFAGGVTENIDSGEVPADGNIQLTSSNVNNGPGARAGYCVFPYRTTSGQLGFTGGALAGTSTQGVAGSISDVNPTQFGSNWNAGWTGTGEKLIACVKEKPFVFIVGGTDETRTSSRTLSNFT